MTKKKKKCESNKKTRKADLQGTDTEKQYVKYPAFLTINAPNGFLPTTISHGIMQYMTPLLQYRKSDDEKDFERVLKVGMEIWNSCTSQDDCRSLDEIELLNLIKSDLDLNEEDASALLDKMMERKKYLFPEEIQPDIPTMMFIRQEKKYKITAFDYRSLKFPEKTYEPGKEDMAVCLSLNKLDDYIEDCIDYAKWEDFYYETQGNCLDNFYRWLNHNSIQNSELFTQNIMTYLNYVYSYIHEDEITLKSITSLYIKEFLADYIFRQEMIYDPREYTTWPPAMKLFYLYLRDINYLKKPDRVIRIIDRVEPYFVDDLKATYS